MIDWCGNPVCEKRASQAGLLAHREEGTRPCASAWSSWSEADKTPRPKPASEKPAAVKRRQQRFRTKALQRSEHLYTETDVRHHVKQNPQVFYLPRTQEIKNMLNTEAKQ